MKWASPSEGEPHARGCLPWCRRRKPRKGKGVPLPGTPGKSKFGLRADQCGLDLVDRVPGGGGLQLVVDVIDVLHTLGLEPLAEGIGTLLCVDRNAFLPGRAATEHAVELHTGLTGELERLAEFGVADTGRQVDKWLGCPARRFVEQVNGFLLAVRLLSAERPGAF